ncbi:hypothetical protein ARMGADRAFT_735196 [Armillaria gallica]|uniref:Uncharacterized protein n=1 Tax=Armillaria gallica TaxID=47427 RepID=A0A2H3D004_ARMGA|nr:hypothetical protein ARMGADRAFT_735196 [Armillaria gallica]
MLLGKKFLLRFLSQLSRYNLKSSPRNDISSIHSATELKWAVALSEIYRVLALSVWVQIIGGSTISTHMGLCSERMGSILGETYSHKDVAKSLPDMLA